MILDYKKIIPIRYHNASYENDVKDIIKTEVTDRIQKHEGLYIWGPPGGGKTHIACALAKKFLESYINVMFFNTGDFLEKLREEYNKSNSDDESTSLFREVMDFKGILFFDDIGAEKANEWTRERLYLIINKKYEDMTPMIFTSNCDLEILSARMGDRITSRISGMTTRIMINEGDRRLIQK